MSDLPVPETAITAEPRVLIAWLLWCINQGYVRAEDRAVLTSGNWLGDDPATLHPDDAEVQIHLLAMADEVLTAAAPHIDAAARASERERIRQLAIGLMARCEVECDWPECPDGTHYRTHWRPFADLIGGAP